MIGLHHTMSMRGTFALSDITSIGEPNVARSGQVETSHLELSDGREARLLGFEVAELMRRPVQLLPAEPGTCRIFGEVAEEPLVWTDAVIAWALCVDGQVRAVTPGGVLGGANSDVYVELPGGSIYGVGQDVREPAFDNREAYVGWLRSQWLERQQGNAETQQPSAER